MLFRDMGWTTFTCGVLGMLLVCILWLWKRDAFFSGCMVIQFLFLMLLALDRGLLRCLYVIGSISGRLGEDGVPPWPPRDAVWVGVYRVMPLVLAVTLSVWAVLAIALTKARIPFRVWLPAAIVSVVANLQGLFAIRWLSWRDLFSVMTDNTASPPWTIVSALGPTVLVLLAIGIAVLGYARGSA